MSALSKVLTILALWLLYTLALYFLAPDSLCLGCLDEEAAVTGAVAPVETEPAVARYPIDFQWSDATAFTNEGYPALRDEVLAGRTEDNLLEITGLYYQGEPAPEGYENMGFARADRVRELLGIPEDRAELKARLMDGADEARTGYFEGVLFEWTDPEATAEMVEELPDRINIRFPYNSTEEDYNPEVQEYLRELSARMQDGGGRILLTGHTDNSGSEEYNMELGRRRAEHIRNILVRSGVPAEIIQVESSGERQPIASNETAEGRHENRRVEVRIIEQ